VIEQAPQPGDFAVVRVNGDVGRLIRLGQWLYGRGYADFEHAFVLVEDGQVVEAEPGGARLAPLSEYDGRRIEWSTGRIALTDWQRARIVTAAEDYVGTPYSAADYFALAAHHLHLPGGPLLRRYVADSRHMICSQLVDQCYQDAGVKLFNDQRWPGFVTPADLYGLIRQDSEQR
jgi:cell wall-associated NlpC family hydrolase